MRLVVRLAILAVILGLVVLAFGWRTARADPIVRQANVALAGWPQGERPLRVVLLSDLHMGNATMSEERLERVIDRINALRPDLVLMAGDFIAGHDPDSSRAIAPGLTVPLRRLRPALATVAVLGNHDHWTGAGPLRAALDAAGVVTLSNEARRFGPLTVAGVDDEYTGRADPAAALAAARSLGGPRLLLTHGPDVVPTLAKGSVALILAGHTHCGQIVLPLLGALAVPSSYGERYLCGVRQEGGRATIVTAGLGTSVLPLRYGAAPDMWLLTIGG